MEVVRAAGEQPGEAVSQRPLVSVDPDRRECLEDIGLCLQEEDGLLVISDCDSVKSGEIVGKRSRCGDGEGDDCPFSRWSATSSSAREDADGTASALPTVPALLGQPSILAGHEAEELGENVAERHPPRAVSAPPTPGGLTRDFTSRFRLELRSPSDIDGEWVQRDYNKDESVADDADTLARPSPVRPPGRCSGKGETASQARAGQRSKAIGKSKQRRAKGKQGKRWRRRKARRAARRAKRRLRKGGEGVQTRAVRRTGDGAVSS